MTTVTKPKRAPSTFVLFCNAERGKLNEAEPTLTFGEVSKRLGEMWGKLAPDEKKKFDEPLAALRLKCDEDLAVYKQMYSEIDEEKDYRKRIKNAQKLACPRRAPGAFLLFSNAERSKLKAAEPTLTFGEVGKKLGEMWGKLTGDQKNEFNGPVAALRLKYDEELAVYKQAYPDKDEKGDRKRIKKSRKPPGPTRAPSAFLLFAKDARPKMRTINPALSFGDLGKKLGEMWQALDTVDRHIWIVRSNAEKTKLQGNPATETTRKGRPRTHTDDDDDDDDDDDAYGDGDKMEFQ